MGVMAFSISLRVICLAGRGEAKGEGRKGDEGGQGKAAWQERGD